MLTYYPVKYFIGTTDSTYDANRYLQYFVEFEYVYICGPLAAPILVIDSCTGIVRERHARYKQKIAAAYLQKTVKDLSKDILRITEAYTEASAQNAARELTTDLNAIVSAPSDKLYGSTSFAAISVLEQFADRIYRHDKKRLLWRIAESKQIVHEHRTRNNR